MKIIRLPIILFLCSVAGNAWAQDYRRTINVILENSAPFPNHVQVRDMEARTPLPEDCRVAKKVARQCQADPNLQRPYGADKMTCAVALALMDEPRCSIKGLIFDDWMDGDTSVEVTIHTGREGFGYVAVRAVNNTESWTFKPGLRDGDTVHHQ